MVVELVPDTRSAISRGLGDSGSWADVLQVRQNLDKLRLGGLEEPIDGHGGVVW